MTQTTLRTLIVSGAGLLNGEYIETGKREFARQEATLRYETRQLLKGWFIFSSGVKKYYSPSTAALPPKEGWVDSSKNQPSTVKIRIKPLQSFTSPPRNTPPVLLALAAATAKPQGKPPLWTKAKAAPPCAQVPENWGSLNKAAGEEAREKAAVQAIKRELQHMMQWTDEAVQPDLDPGFVTRTNQLLKDLEDVQERHIEKAGKQKDELQKELGRSVGMMKKKLEALGKKRELEQQKHVEPLKRVKHEGQRISYKQLK